MNEIKARRAQKAECKYVFAITNLINGDNKMSHNVYSTKLQQKLKSQEKNIQKIRVLADLINQLNAQIENARLKNKDTAFKARYKKLIEKFQDNQINNQITYRVLSETMGMKKDFTFSRTIKINDMQEITLTVNKIWELINEK